MKKAVVTGATGFVGRHVVWELLDAGYTVTALVRSPAKANALYRGNPTDAFLHTVECELSQLKNYAETAGEKGDVFFHLAWEGVSGALLRDYDTQMKNMRYAIDAIRAAKTLGCKRFVGAGSLHENECMNELETSTSEVGLGNYYKAAKLSAHYFCQTEASRIGIEFLWPRLTNAYGAGERSERLLNSVIRQLLRGESPALTDGTQLYNFIYVTDAARAFRLLAEKGRPFAHYILGSEDVRPLREYLAQVQQIVAPEVPMGFGKHTAQGIHLSEKELYSPALRQDTGFETSVSFADGIRRTMDQMKDQV